MLIRIIRNAQGQTIECSPQHVPSDTGNALITAGLAVAVDMKSLQDRIQQLSPKPEKGIPKLIWSCCKGQRVGDHTPPPYLFVRCERCGFKTSVTGPRSSSTGLPSKPPALADTFEVRCCGGVATRIPHSVREEFNRLRTDHYNRFPQSRIRRQDPPKMWPEDKRRDDAVKQLRYSTGEVFCTYEEPPKSTT
jgi:hypothetical protein